MVYATSAQGADHTAGLIMDPSVPREELAIRSQELQLVIATNDGSGKSDEEGGLRNQTCEAS